LSHDGLRAKIPFDLGTKKLTGFVAKEIARMSEYDWLRIRCPLCVTRLTVSDTELRCSKCGAFWSSEDGIVTFLEDSPEPSSPCFSAEVYERLYRNENLGYFMYWGTVQALQALLSRAYGFLSGLKTLDIGCGTGYALSRLREYGATVIGVDQSLTALRLARKRGVDQLFRASAERLPFEDTQFDLVLSIHVYEHIEDDLSAMAEARRVLVPGGKHAVIVPAVRSLCSRCDEIQGHKRRYTRLELDQKLRGAGFHVDRITYLQPLLFLPAYIVRTMNRIVLPEEKGKVAALKEYAMPPRALNSLLKAALLLEARSLSKCDFPFGIALAAMAAKPG